MQEWDFGDRSLSEILAGIDAATKRGRGVINISGGFLGFDTLLEQAVDRALRRGSIVVAAVGNDREQGSRSFVPASLPHVLTVGATDQNDHVAFFSNRSSALDLAAPGVAMPVAVPALGDPSGYSTFDGTSFSAPLVAGATAWVWTLRPELDPTQLQDVMRDSARDVGPKGWDADTGFGILSIPAALAARTPAKDPQEPNDDINLVRPHAVTASGTRLSTPARLQARLDVTEDPEDVYRVWVPAHWHISAGTHSTSNVNLALWGPKTRTVYERGSALRRDLVAYSERTGSRPDAVTGRNSARRGAFYYLDAFLGKRVGAASYSLKVSVSPLDRRLQSNGRLAHANAGSLELEALDQRGRDRRCDRLEQPELPAAGDLLHAANDLAVVDGSLEPVGRSAIRDLEPDVVEEGLRPLALLLLDTVGSGNLEAVELHRDAHRATIARAVVRASTCSRTSCARKIEAPRS